MTFARKSVEAIGGNWSDVRKLNEVLDNLRNRCIERIERTGYLAESKIAWKIRVLEQTFLYRSVMLAEACTGMWNSRNTLGSILTARAKMETIAVFRDFEKQLSKLLATHDLGGIDKLVTDRTFSTRLPKLMGDAKFPPAANVLGFVDKLEHDFAGARNHYDVLSEFCHPNYFGHLMIFGDLDPETGTVSLSKGKSFNQGIFVHILAPFALMGLLEESLDRIDKFLPEIAIFQKNNE